MTHGDRMMCAHRPVPPESGYRGRRFIDVCRKVTTKKPVILLKAGRTSAGARAGPRSRFGFRPDPALPPTGRTRNRANAEFLRAQDGRIANVNPYS